MPGTLFVVATPIGNLEDVTARALRVLREVSLIAAEDTRRTAKLLSRYGITTPTTSFHEHNEHQKAGSLIERLKSGQSIALVSDAGTPTLSDPGAHLISLALEEGLLVSPVPGPSALTALLSVAGIAAERFTFLGFPPTRSNARSEWFERLRNSSPLAIFYESPHRIAATLADLQRVVGDVRITVGRELTKSHEELVKGHISTVSVGLEPRGEFVVAVEIGHMDENSIPLAPPGPADIASEFVRLTNIEGSTRRQAIASLSRKHKLSARTIFAFLEEAKGSVG